MIRDKAICNEVTTLVCLSGQKLVSKRICFFLLRELRLDLEDDLPFFETCFSALPSSISVCWSGRAGGVPGHGVCFAGATTSKGGPTIHLHGSISLQSDMDVKFHWYRKIIWSSKKLLWSKLLDEMTPSIIFLYQDFNYNGNNIVKNLKHMQTQQNSNSWLQQFTIHKNSHRA